MLQFRVNVNADLCHVASNIFFSFSVVACCFVGVSHVFVTLASIIFSASEADDISNQSPSLNSALCNPDAS